MKKKILTLMLSAVMVFSLAACSSKEEPVAETEASSEEEKTEQVSEPSEPEIEEPEQVELTADTIDKYFGFEYTDVADDSVTGFELTVTESYGTATVNAPSVPVRYSDAAPSTVDLAQTIQENYPSIGSIPVLNPFTALSVTVNYGLDSAFDVPMTGIHERHTTGKDDSALVEGAIAWVDVDPTASWCDQTQPEANNFYAIMMPNDTFNAIKTETKALKLLVTNPTENYAIVDNCDITGLDMPFATDVTSVTVAGDITAESAIEDVVAKHAPTSGTIDENNGNILLTWVTKSGTTMTITFDKNNNKAFSVKILANGIADDILSQF